MGQHYWRHFSLTSDSCEDAAPVFLMYEQGVLVGFGIVLFSMGRVPTVGGVLPSQHPSGPPGLFVAPGDSAWEFPVPPFEPFFLKPGPHPLASAAKWPISRSGTAPPPALPA